MKNTQWELTPGGVIREAGSKYQDCICQMPFSSDAEAKEMGPEQMEHANLIVAAPELLTALKNVAKIIKKEYSNDLGLYQPIERLIAKAEGR